MAAKMTCDDEACSGEKSSTVTILLDGVLDEFYSFLEHHVGEYRRLYPDAAQVVLERVDGGQGGGGGGGGVTGSGSAKIGRGDFTDLERRIVEEAEAHQRKKAEAEAEGASASNAGTSQDLSKAASHGESSSNSTWDAAIFPAQLTGSLVEAGALWDLTPFVRRSAQLEWHDVLPFLKHRSAVYDRRVRTLPLDGDSLLLYYRKDLLDAHNLSVPKTWDEYTDVARRLHGIKVPVSATDIREGRAGKETTTIYGSCVSRAPKCANAYWSSLILSSMTQSQGTDTGFLLDTTASTKSKSKSKTKVEPLMGRAWEETIRHSADQMAYGHPDELRGPCLAANLAFARGECALTYSWGNIMDAIHIANKDKDKTNRTETETETETGTDNGPVFGVAPAPGSRKVLDRDTGLLKECTPETCPHAEIVYQQKGGQGQSQSQKYGDGNGNGGDIYRINRAPYGAFGGWAAGISSYTTPERQIAVANFLAYVSNKRRSMFDVLPNERSSFSQPYRYSHVAAGDEWKAYFRDSLVEGYLDATHAQTTSSNAVLELRIPQAAAMRNILDEEVFAFLNATASTTTDIFQNENGAQVTFHGMGSGNIFSHRNSHTDEFVEWTAEQFSLQIGATPSGPMDRRVLQASTDAREGQITTLSARRRSAEAAESRMREFIAKQSPSFAESYQRSIGTFQQRTLSPDLYISDSARHIGWGFMVCICFGAFALFLWAISNRKHMAVQMWSPCILLQCAIGTFLIGLTILPLSLDESLVDLSVLNTSCLISPWMYSIGFTLFFSAVFVKIKRSEKVLSKTPTRDSLKVNPMATFRTTARVFTVNGTLMGLWTALDPLQWEVHPDTGVGACRGGDDGVYIGFAVLMFVVNTIMVAVAVLQAFHRHKLETYLDEMVWLPLTIYPFAQAWVIGAPILAIYSSSNDNPTAVFATLVVVISSSSISAMLALFVPVDWGIRKYPLALGLDEEEEMGHVRPIKFLAEHSAKKEISRLSSVLESTKMASLAIEREICSIKLKILEASIPQADVQPFATFSRQKMTPSRASSLSYHTTAIDADEAPIIHRIQSLTPGSARTPQQLNELRRIRSLTPASVRTPQQLNESMVIYPLISDSSRTGTPPSSDLRRPKPRELFTSGGDESMEYSGYASSENGDNDIQSIQASPHTPLHPSKPRHRSRSLSESDTIIESDDDEAETTSGSLSDRRRQSKSEGGISDDGSSGDDKSEYGALNSVLKVGDLRAVGKQASILATSFKTRVPSLSGLGKMDPKAPLSAESSVHSKGSASTWQMGTHRSGKSPAINGKRALSANVASIGSQSPIQSDMPLLSKLREWKGIATNATSQRGIISQHSTLKQLDPLKPSSLTELSHANRMDPEFNANETDSTSLISISNNSGSSSTLPSPVATPLGSPPPAVEKEEAVDESLFSRQGWEAAGLTASILATLSDSYSSGPSGSDSASVSASSIDASRRASALDILVATELDRLIGARDWNLISEKVSQTPTNQIIEKKRQRKRDLEAWKASVSSSLLG